MPSTRVPSPKSVTKTRPAPKTIDVGDEIDIRVKVLGRRSMPASTSFVAREVVTLQIPGHRTPVTVDVASLLLDE